MFIQVRASQETTEKVWVCKKCLRVVKDEYGRPGCHTKKPGKGDYCDGEWIKKPLG